ncbi:hypothetical protein [Halobaculum litoreum]|uniref:hypothetical protein n=1 Tax=Halobaculum litoreum TaxID=3031998 RepID=UPI0024C3438A|nr:hypothetical protein [Halobaculum sp. DT92]
MPHRQLRKIGTDSVGIVLERSDFLERDGILDDEGDLPENTTAFTERLGERTYLVRVPEDGYVPARTSARRSGGSPGRSSWRTMLLQVESHEQINREWIRL